MSNMVGWIAAEAERPKVEENLGFPRRTRHLENKSGRHEGRQRQLLQIFLRQSRSPSHRRRSNSESGRKRTASGNGGPTGEERWLC